jgi:hypothetical protein
MRVVNRFLLAVVVFSLLLLAVAAMRVKAAGGLTLTPATLTLTLEKGTSEVRQEFALTNNYDTPIILRFAFEASAGSRGNPAEHLRVEQNYVSLGAKETLRQSIILKDSDQLSPGSQAVDLVISQAGTAQSNVGVLPSIRMPLILVKTDGAVSALGLASFGNSRLSFMVPGSVDATIENKGNMIAIPRGTVTITAPDGSVVSQGVLNTSSVAISPGNSLGLATPMTHLENAVWPGIYRATLSYGLGGGQPAQTASAWFVYVAWWHVALGALLGAGGYYLMKYGHRLRRMQPPKPRAHHPPPKRALLIGRDIS